MKLNYALCLLMMFSALAAADDSAFELAAVNSVIDDFHAAAAAGNRSEYLGLMTDDGVFLGTDEWERWPKQPEFTDYVDAAFKDGTGWTFAPVERTVAFSASGDIAWFDEVVVSEQYGRFRGTGVLSREDGQWRIAHYALSFLVLNENWDEVSALTRKTLEAKKQ
jgi:ketosteroid isomerase-like protein